MSEGTVGAARIIKMLDVWDDRLVVDAKGIYTIESFLIARRQMYWQVYLHKTSVAAEKMLGKILQRARALIGQGITLFAPPALHFFLSQKVTAAMLDADGEVLRHYLDLDDSDIISAIKVWAACDDTILSTLCRRYTDRRLFKAVTGDERATFDTEEMKRSYAAHFDITPADAEYFFVSDVVSSHAYNPDGSNIVILYPDGTLDDVVRASDMFSTERVCREVEKPYLFYMPL